MGWSACSTSCGRGWLTRERTILAGPRTVGKLVQGSCRRRRDAWTRCLVPRVLQPGTRVIGGCSKTELGTIDLIIRRKYLEGYIYQGPDEVTKNRQKTEPERTIYKVNNTIPRVQ